MSDRDNSFVTALNMSSSGLNDESCSSQTNSSIHQEDFSSQNTFAIPLFDGLDFSMSGSDNSIVTDGNMSDHTYAGPNEESWFSQRDSSIHQEDFTRQNIPVHISPWSVREQQSYRKPPIRKNGNNITIKRDNRFIEALSLPIFSVYNMRSIWSKLSSLSEDMEERETDFSILAEVWEKKENPKHKHKIEEIFEMKDLEYFSIARPGAKRGRGAAITSKGNRFHVSKLNIDIPKPLEVVWGLLRPKVLIGEVSKIVICSFYCPPKSKKKGALIDHMAITINKLKIVHPKASYIIAGDKNDLNENEILAICPSFRQIVLQPTRKSKILTIVITDLHRFFQEPFIIPPVPVDKDANGVPSDHQGVLVLPVSSNATVGKTKKSISVRPIKQSALDSFGQRIVLEDWGFMDPNSSSSFLVEEFQLHCTSLVEHYFPMKTVQVSSFDQPFFTDRLRALRRQRQREYRRSGKSEKYLKIKNSFDEAFLNEAHKYKDKLIAEVAEGKRGSSYKAIKKLGTGKVEDVNFQIPSHVESDFSAQESAETIADHFSRISQEFDPIDPSKFSPSLKNKLSQPMNDIPVLREYEVYHKIVSAKKPNSFVPGDLPKKVVQSFAPELAKPVQTIFNAITQNAEYPRQWIIEQQTPIPKQYPVNNEDDLRNISGTPFFSKVYEAFLSDWLLPIVQPFLDPANCGGLKGTSITHYLIRLLHFTHATVDQADPHAVVLALVDLSKAFNRVDHTLLIEDLHNMNVPSWLLKILISYLTERSMVLRFHGATSSPRSLPGSAPQGVFLGCFFFMVKFNGAFLRPSVPRPFVKPKPLMLSKPTSCTVKYIDDASQACAVKLKKALTEIEISDRPRPLEFWEHTGFVLDTGSNQLQKDLNNLKSFTEENLMVINQKKTIIMSFNFRTSLKFPPIFRIGDGPMLDIQNQARILGIIISDDLKWSAHVDFMVKRANKKLWQLRRMKLLKLDVNILLDFYCKEVRSILEFGVAVWNSGLTNRMREQIERIQKVCVNIILCDTDWNIPYEVGCTLLNIEPLLYRREDLCIKFIQRASCDERHADMFCRNTNPFDTRTEKPLYRDYRCRTGRFYDSPLCYLTRLLNMNPVKVDNC